MWWWHPSSYPSLTGWVNEPRQLQSRGEVIDLNFVYRLAAVPSCVAGQIVEKP